MNDLIKIQPGAGVLMVANANEANDMFSTGGDGPRLPKLSIRGGVFRYKKGGVEQNLNTRTLQIVLVGARKPTQRAYFSKAWGGADDTATMPDCASDNGVAPEPRRSSPSKWHLRRLPAKCLG
jgi:hypothetical protein